MARWRFMTQAHAPPGSYGDCWAACIESLIDDGDECPRPSQLNMEGDTYFDEVSSWLAKKGLAVARIYMDGSTRVLFAGWEQALYIATGPRLGGSADQRHCCVYRGPQLHHDPAQGGTQGLSSIAWVEFLFPADPTRGPNVG